MERSELLIFYEKAFDAEGKVKICGRDTTRQLILACQEMSKGTPYDGYDFGSVKTGYMNMDNVRGFCRFVKNVHSFSGDR